MCFPKLIRLSFSPPLTQMTNKHPLCRYRDASVEFHIKPPKGKKHKHLKINEDIVRTLIQMHKTTGADTWKLNDSDYPKKHLVHLRAVKKMVNGISVKGNDFHGFLQKSLDFLIAKQTELVDKIAELNKARTPKAHSQLDAIIDRPMDFV